jgi:hypothetical protein
MKKPHIKVSSKNGALLVYISNKRAILAHYQQVSCQTLTMIKIQLLD